MRQILTFTLLYCAACELAPSEPSLPILATVDGRVAGMSPDTPSLDVLLSWYLFTLVSDSETTWLTTEREPVEGDTIRLNLTVAPPPDAFFSVDGELEVALAFFALVDRGAPEFDFTVPTESGLPTYGGSEELLLLYLNEPRPREWAGEVYDPGYNLVLAQPDADSDDLTYRRLPFDGLVLDIDAGWFPSGGTCDLPRDELPLDLTVSDPEFPEQIPDLCEQCGRSVVFDECLTVFDGLCLDCERFRLVYDASLDDRWPCLPGGQTCSTGDQTCSLGMLYECVDGVFRATQDCRSGGDCCEAGCAPIP